MTPKLKPILSEMMFSGALFAIAASVIVVVSVSTLYLTMAVCNYFGL